MSDTSANSNPTPFEECPVDGHSSPVEDRQVDGHSVPYEKRPSDGRGGKVVPLRLQRYLARSGVASRRSSENLITAGRVKVNGEVVTQLGTKVDPLSDRVEVDDKVIEWDTAPTTIMLNKPAGVITTMKAQSDKPIVADLVPVDDYPGLYPIGRLDSDTTGILLFTTDGDLGNLLLHPSHHVSKTYVAQLEEPITEEAMQSLREGVVLDDGLTAPAEVEVVADDVCAVRLTIHEGRYHQVKRMLDAVGFPVVSLHREKFGSLVLNDLPEGSWRELTDQEQAELRAESESGAKSE